MPWVKLDDGWYDNPKFLDLDTAAVGLWVIGLTYCARHLTDGYIPSRALGRVCPGYPDAAPVELVARGLWDTAADGWIVHDYHDYQPSAEEVKARRDERRDAGRRGGLAKAKANAVAKAVAGASAPSRPAPPRPDPEESLSLTLVESDGVGFESFWTLYPRKVGKAAALKAWTKAVKGNTGRAIHAGLSRQLAVSPSLGANERRFIPHPSTWLNEGRWDDEITAPAATGKTAAHDRSRENVITMLKEAGYE